MERRRRNKGDEETIPLVPKVDGSATRQSKEHIEEFRFIVVGGDEDLLNEACDRILRVSQEDHTSHHKACELRQAVNGHQVSVVKTPSNWLKCLRSFFFSRAVKSLKNEMEFSESLVFPGPHAFLIVLPNACNTGKEHYFLRAFSDNFGKESLDYCMVIFLKDVTPEDAGQNRCVRKLWNYRYHILKNTDSSVDELFGFTKEMVQCKKNSFFTNHSDYLEKAERYFRKQFENVAQIEQMENKLKELEKELSKAQQNERQLRKEVNIYRDRERQLESGNAELQRDVQQLKALMEDVRKSLSYNRVQGAPPLATLQPESLRMLEKQLLFERREDDQNQREFQSTGDVQYKSPSRTAPSGDEEEEDTEGTRGSNPYDGSKRRNSNEIGKPNMSTSDNRSLDSL